MIYQSLIEQSRLNISLNTTDYLCDLVRISLHSNYEIKDSILLLNHDLYCRERSLSLHFHPTKLGTEENLQRTRHFPAGLGPSLYYPRGLHNIADQSNQTGPLSVRRSHWSRLESFPSDTSSAILCHKEPAQNALPLAGSLLHQESWLGKGPLIGPLMP